MLKNKFIFLILILFIGNLQSSDVNQGLFSGDMEIFRTALNHGSVDSRFPEGRFKDFTPLMFAVYGKNGLQRAKLLIANKADPDLVDNESGATALIMAAILGQTEMVRLLIGSRADLNILDKSGNSALTWAKKMGNQEIADLLIKAGAR